MLMTFVAFAIVLKVCKDLLISVVITRMLIKSNLMLRRLLMLFFLLKKLKYIQPLLFFFRALNLNFLVKCDIWEFSKTNTCWMMMT